MSVCEKKSKISEKIIIIIEESMTRTRVLRLRLKMAGSSRAITTTERKAQASEVIERRLRIMTSVESIKDCMVPTK